MGEANERKVWLIGGFTWALKLMSHVTGLINKAFGNFTYDQGMSKYSENYINYSLKDSIRITETK